MNLSQGNISEMVTKGVRLNEVMNRPDSALYYFTIASSSYSPSLPKSEKEACVRAMLGKWVVLYGAYYDYPQAFETLVKAQDICEKEGLEIPRVYVALASVYQLLSQASGEEALNDSALLHYRKAIELNSSPAKREAGDLAFTNVLQIFSNTGNRRGLQEIWDVYSTFTTNETNPRREFNRNLYTALQLAQKGQFEDATEIALQTIKSVPELPEYRRMKIIGLMAVAKLFRDRKDYSNALSLLKEALEFCNRNRLIDAEWEIYLEMAENARLTGDRESEKEYRLRALEIKDSISFDSNHLRLDEIRLLHTAQKANEEITQINADRKIRGHWILFLAVIVGVTIFFAIVILKKNKRLKEQMEVLYRHSIESTEAHPTSRKEPEKKEEENREVQNQTRYTGSRLSEKTREELGEAIEAYFKTSCDIFQNDFTVGKLATALGSNPKYISQTINTNFGSNFNTYLNRYRVFEACRRFRSDEEWERLTLEAAAEQVGFKSRTSFINAFKRETGLTPSEYKKQVKIAQNKGQIPKDVHNAVS